MVLRVKFFSEFKCILECHKFIFYIGKNRKNIALMNLKN